LIGAAASSPSAVGSRAGKRGDPGASPQADHVLVLVPSTTDKTLHRKVRPRNAARGTSLHSACVAGKPGGSARCGHAREFRRL